MKSDFVSLCNSIFPAVVVDYHMTNDVNIPMRCSYPEGTIEYDLYHKCWIDTVQWHLEDIIRDPEIDPVEALALKRRIDRSNQERTDLVEKIDSYFWSLYHEVKSQLGAHINTESPAWAIDRLSILHVKIYHMQEQVSRTDVSQEQHDKCEGKLKVLKEQLDDMTMSISQLLADYASGARVMKVYRQMKMYNDPSLNPVLYGKK